MKPIQPPAGNPPPAVLVDPIAADFRNFLYLVWKHLGLPDPTPVQYDIAYALQHGEKRMVIEAFRGVGKSWITSAFVLWLLYCNPDTKILVVSASKQRADDFSTFTKRLISEMDILHHLIARDGQRDSNVAFDVGPAKAAHAPSVKSVGITGQLAGSRADVIIADDIEIPNNSLTQLMRDKLLQIVKEFDAVLTPKPESRVIYLGTPQTEMSVYNSLPERGYVTRIWPARYPTLEKAVTYGNKLASFVMEKLESNPTLGTQYGARGAPVDPHRFSHEDLLEREGSYGRSGFALQFMLDTTLSDAEKYPLKMGDLIVMSVSPEMAPVQVIWGSGYEQVINNVPIVGFQGDRLHKPMFISKDFTPYQGKVMAIDPSGRGGDEVGYAVVGMLHGMLFGIDLGGHRGGYDDATLEALARTAKRNGVKEIIIESNFGDGMFTKLFGPWLAKVGYPCTITEVNHNVQKEKRIIDTLEPVLNQHRFVVSEEVIKRDQENYNTYATETAHRYQLFYQMTRITKDRGSLVKDDRLDALAMAVAYWVEQLDLDNREAEKRYREDALDKELESFMDHVFGMEPKSLNWMGSV